MLEVVTHKQCLRFGYRTIATNKKALMNHKGCHVVAEGEGLEPPQDHSRRFSRPLQYHYASPPLAERITSVTAKMHKFYEKQHH